jgi:hypothetical protein
MKRRRLWLAQHDFSKTFKLTRIIILKCRSTLSKCSILGASLGGLILNLQTLHPNNQIRVPSSTTFSSPPSPILSSKMYTRPLIDYDMALFLAPMEMAGAVLGVLIQKILPNWLYLTCAAIVLAITCYKTYAKYFSTRNAELASSSTAVASPREEEEESNSDMEEATLQTPLLPENAPLPPVGLTTVSSATTWEFSNTESGSEAVGSIERNDNGNVVVLLRNDHPDETTNTTGLGTTKFSPEQVDECHKLLERDARQYPHEKLAALVALWAGLVLLTFLKGGKGVESIVGITCHSSW